MALIKYLIKEGDTLESIALKQNKTPLQIKNTHNTHCKFQDFILGNEFPKNLEFLIMEIGIRPITKEDEEEMHFFYFPTLLLLFLIQVII